MPQNPALDATATARLTGATDAFIESLLPDWLQRASPAQINRLRDRFTLYRVSQQRVRAATLDLIPLGTFAKTRFSDLLEKTFPTVISLDSLEWLEVSREFGHVPGTRWPFYRPRYTREAGLLRLMQNFHPDDTLLTGSGLVEKGTDNVLSGDPAAFAAACRKLDVGQQYQAQLSNVFNASTARMLADEKRSGLQLAVEVAALKGEISAAEQIALHEVAHSHHDANQQGLRGYPGLLKILGCDTSDALVVQFRGVEGEDQGLVLYLPSDPQRALQRFDSWQALAAALIGYLREAQYRNGFSQLIALCERPQFLSTLGKRLSDDAPDLALEGLTLHTDVFADLVERQIARIQQDARLLLVPTAEADRQARLDRLHSWETVGLGLVNLAGLFIPGVGALLLGLLVVQTLSDVYEGAVDWLQGHQHEALEHLLGVAETVAVTAALAVGGTVVARGFARSSYVDGLDPVRLDSGQRRLWANELERYATVPDDTGLQDDGLYGSGQRRWMRDGDRYYEVHRPADQGPWRLRHPYRPQAFGPIVRFNGERSWCLSLERPLEWDDSARMLDRLWPQDPPASAEQAAQVLQVALMDQDGLRGLLVERRQLPVNLRETLRRFDADRRTEAFFASVEGSGDVHSDERIQAWCLSQPSLAGLEAALLRERLREQAPVLRGRLFTHLSEVELPHGDALLDAVRRDFPSLPPAYALEAISAATDAQRDLARIEARVPVQIAQQAHSLLRLGRCNRAVEGLYLTRTADNDTGELIFALLRRLPNWPSGVNLLLRDGSEHGRLLAVLNPQSIEEPTAVLVQRAGQVSLYDAGGLPLDVEVSEPSGYFEAIAALLSDDQIARLPGDASAAPERLREAVIGQLSASGSSAESLRRLLGWAPQVPWLNPGRRLADGRVGYELSGRRRGRSRSARTTLQDRVRALYPSFSDHDVEQYLRLLSSLPDSPMSLLIEQQLAYEDLDHTLTTWEHAEPVQSRQRLRRQMTDIIRRCWRLEGDHINQDPLAAVDMRLDLSNFPARSLPPLPSDVDLSHVSELVLSGLQLDTVPEAFLRGFANVRRLTINGNNLLGLPTSIGYLSRLETLRLAHNRIRLDVQAVAIMASLPNLANLDLSFNPLGFTQLRFNHFLHLRELRLRNCRLSTWPFGLELCAELEHVDLRDNQLGALPVDILQMPLTFRRAFVLERNPLSSASIVQLYSVQDADRLHALLDAAQVVESPAQPGGLAPWLEGQETAQRTVRSEQWRTLIAMPDSTSFFDLLDELRSTADYELNRAHLTEQVWSILGVLYNDAQLRQRIFQATQNAHTCADGIAERFSTLQIQVQAAVAERDAPFHERGSHLISLGRQLFRLERLEQFARRDIAERIRQARGVDEIEVILFYRVQLARDLNLPAQPLAMRYGTAAAVTEAQLAEARQDVRAAETDEAVARSLSLRDFWQAYLRERHDTAFDAIDQAYSERGTQLDEQQQHLTSQVYAERWDELSTARASALQTLTLQLTREALLEQQARIG